MELQSVVARPNPSARSSVRATSTSMQRNWRADVSWHAPRTKSSSNRARAAASIDADRCDRASASESTVESGCEYRCVQRLSLTSVAAWRPGGTSQGQVVDHLARSFDHLLRRLRTVPQQRLSRSHARRDARNWEIEERSKSIYGKRSQTDQKLLYRAVCGVWHSTAAQHTPACGARSPRRVRPPPFGSAKRSEANEMR